MVLAQIQRDLLIAFRGRSELANPMAFFVLVTMLFGLGIGPNPDILARVGPGAIWVVALFASMLAMESLFRRDYDDGTLEIFLMHQRPLFLGVLGKLLAHWSVTGLPVALLSPLAAYLMNLDARIAVILVVTLLLGTPVLTLIGGIGAALTVGLGRGGLLLALIVMPLYVPILVFGAGACYRVQQGEEIVGQLLWLTALLGGSITLAPFAIGPALKISQEY